MSSSWPALHAQLLRSTTRPATHRHFRIIRANDDNLSRFADTGSLVSFLHEPGGCRAQKNLVLGALVRAAQQAHDRAQTAQTILLLALWPGLCVVRRRLASLYAPDSERLTADVIGRCCEVLATLDLSRATRVAATVLRNLERDLRRQRIREARVVPVDPGTFDSFDDDQGIIDGPFDDAMTGLSLAALIDRDAPLVAAVVLYGLSQKEAARALGLSHDVARKRYQRAMARLRAAL